MLDQQLQKEIALWVIRLNCDDPNERAQVQLEFAEWQKLHPECLDYIDEMQTFSKNIQQLSTQHHISAQTVQRTSNAVKTNQLNINKLFQGAVLTISILSVSVVMYKILPWNYYLADYHTTTGQMENYTLPDGSKITLAAKSAIKLDFTAKQRRIELVKGEIYIDVAKDPLRPLIVHTKQAKFEALGTRFIIDQSYDQSYITMLHSKVQVTSYPNYEIKTANVGEKIIVNNQGIQTVQSIDSKLAEQAWQQQLIIAENLPLSELLYKLQQYHGNYMIFDHDKLNKIKINGTINAKQDLALTLKLLKTVHPEVDFVQFGNFVTYAKLKE